MDNVFTDEELGELEQFGFNNDNIDYLKTIYHEALVSDISRDIADGEIPAEIIAAYQHAENNNPNPNPADGGKRRSKKSRKSKRSKRSRRSRRSRRRKSRR